MTAAEGGVDGQEGKQESPREWNFADYSTTDIFFIKIQVNSLPMIFLLVWRGNLRSSNHQTLSSKLVSVEIDICMYIIIYSA